jgi:hypothetical protein
MKGSKRTTPARALQTHELALYMVVLYNLLYVCITNAYVLHICYPQDIKAVCMSNESILHWRPPTC